MIKSAEVENLAILARLALDPAELAAIAKDLGSILDYVKQLSEVTIPADQPEMTDAMAPINVFREDVVAPFPAVSTGDLIVAAPKHDEHFVRVKKIL